LQRGPALLMRVTDHQARAGRWENWFSGHLPAALYARISGISEEHGNLCIFAVSAAWSARLRYAICELEAEIRAVEPALRGIEVRVLPRA
jgi:hypothetical protein